MTKYIFHIGSNLHLSFAEIVSVYGLKSIKGYQRDYILVELNFEFTQSHLDKLGSVIEVYKVLDEASFLTEDYIISDLSSHNFESKVLFGVSSNFLDGKHKLDILKRSKKGLKISTRFLESITAASIKSGGALNVKTFVYGFFEFAGAKYFSRLAAIQDIDFYSRRDFGKPYRSAKLGMLPPKLSQVMLNLAGGKSVYDPFCGTGTILLEGVLAGKKVKGSDLQAVNVEGTKNNLQWLVDNFKYHLGEVSLNFDKAVFEADATKMKAEYLKDVDAIVTEGFLGAPKRGTEYDKELEEEIVSLGELYYNFLKAIAKVNSLTGLTIVLTLPVFKGSKPKDPKNFFIENLVEKLPALGYSVSALVPSNDFGIKAKESVLYKRNDQKVFRQVYRLTHRGK